jgi:hypothetical protein
VGDLATVLLHSCVMPSPLGSNQSEWRLGAATGGPFNLPRESIRSTLSLVIVLMVPVLLLLFALQPHRLKPRHGARGGRSLLRTAPKASSVSITQDGSLRVTQQACWTAGWTNPRGV